MEVERSPMGLGEHGLAGSAGIYGDDQCQLEPDWVSHFDKIMNGWRSRIGSAHFMSSGSWPEDIPGP
jgi:hypothetical protein